MKINLYNLYYKFLNKFELIDDDFSQSLFFRYLILIESTQFLGNELPNINSEEISEFNYLFNELKNTIKITPEKLGQTFEKIINKKTTGAYYTPSVVTKNITNRVLEIAQTKFKLNELKILDPTCGAGAFLVDAFRELVNLKIKKYENSMSLDEIIIESSSQIFGIDIVEVATEITLFRLNILAIELGLTFSKMNRLDFKITSGNSVFGEVRTINGKSFNKSSVKSINSEKEPFNWIGDFSADFNVILGNPPYIETKNIVDFVSDLELSKTGNIYASVLERSVQLLTENGVMGMIIPISFSSTKRMKPVFDFVYSNSKKLIVQSYADRPGTLFSGVHQKLNIIYSIKGRPEKKEFYTTNYLHFKTLEVNDIFSAIKEFSVDPRKFSTIPKIGTHLEYKLLSKIIKTPKNDFSTSFKSEYSLFLNSRAGFWMKVFIGKSPSKDYLKLDFHNEKTMRNYYSILNSSLFFWFWESVSDGWHIRKSDLSLFNFDLFNDERLVDLSYDVEQSLEKTKKYIGSKQVAFEYKHKLIKKKIDLIDQVLSEILNLTNLELNFIVEYNLNYRMSDYLEQYLQSRR